MKKPIVNAEEIHFVNFTFNPKSRTLQQDDTVFKLRKKQSNALKLLCEKYPEPVSKDEFLAEVWGGSYVTLQSIAQIIRSLRCSLGDDTKSIIVTIPTLGYQLTAQPWWKEPETKPDKYSFKPSFSGNIELVNASFSVQSTLTTIPVSANSKSVIPFSAPKATCKRKKLLLRMSCLSVIVAFFVGVTAVLSH
ncbi:winged helix-turn-helix domain-containing protein [Serratia fonticola]|uniref:winged helix-turn-helix domain-containing protein n=1 Tax=Serratia fonticola TaxID=47917 RepID=UPI003AB0518B